MRDVIFKGSSFDDFNHWATKDKKIFGRIVKLVEEVRRTPFEGSGKPEPLKHQLKGFWSRRITSEHRLVYKATDITIEIISCKYHY
jgi:toxin YoeB